MKPVTLIALGVLAVLALPLLKPAVAPVSALPAIAPSTSPTLGEQFAQRAGESLLDWIFGPHGGDESSGVISIDIA